ncbi:hypothetical protein BT93_I0642 [Corymbia citriodora subsp. variegata]|nr:hypothetical protein BT93_I0642 [Corymbia citriodora subsp. variegata]
MGDMIHLQDLPLGYRFHPTGEEFVTYYLRRRVQGIVDHPCIIPDVDICQHDPSELPDEFHRKSIIGRDYQVQKWWFFNPHAPQKFKNSTQVKRSTPSGYWKRTGDDKEVKAKGSGRVIGTKEYLVFYRGRGKNADKTNWVIHAYHLPANLNGTYVLCRLKYKRDKKADDSTIESERGALIQAYSEMVINQPDHENSYDEAVVQALMDSLRESIQPKKPVEFTADQHQPAYDLTSNWRDEHPVLMNRRARTTSSVHGFFAVEEKKGVVEKKFNGSPLTSEKSKPHPVPGVPHRPMAPPIGPASVQCYSKDEEPRFEKVEQETAAINIKPERISSDETAARAKVQYKGHSSDGNSTKKTNSKEIEYAREESNLVAASTRKTSKSAKSSTNPPLSNIVAVFAFLVLLNIARLVLNF